MTRFAAPTYLEIGPPFDTIFPIDERVLEAITEDMREHGYREHEPIEVWQEGGVILDGHTRRQAAIDSETGEVSFIELSFATEDEALEYAIKKQRNRRNLTDGDLLRLVAELDQRRSHGARDGFRGNRYSSKVSDDTLLESDRTRDHIADTLGISAAKVARTQAVLDHADEDTKAAVERGEVTINKAYNATQERRKQEKAATTSKSTFNRTNANIEWASWTWNPVTGCKHGCKYCYARDIANRFYDQGFEPTFHQARLQAPSNTKVPISDDPRDKRVFVCSMADLFGEWVEQEWIDQVMQQVRLSPQWTFIFLTKNPQRMVDVDWPANAWVGTTVDIQARVMPAREAFAKVNASIKLVSCEPFLEHIRFDDLSMFDWVIIGAQSKSTQCPEMQPDWRWVHDLEAEAIRFGCGIYHKPNLIARSKASPAQRGDA